ncbi:MAG: hypothetical protein IJS74_03660 [Clostridia bacterium]|nr:hypothetical protein [Clostridia bacterium]
MNKKQKITLTLNIIIFIFAVVGSVFCFGEIYISYTKPIEHGFKLLKFFTVQSNVLAGITSLLYIIYLLRERKTQSKIPMWVHVLRYIATIDLIITFMVVALFLGFIVEEGYFSMYTNANFFFHFAIPVLNLISFICYEENPKFQFKHTFIGTAHLLLYSVFYLTVVMLNFHDGAVVIFYDWYAFAQKGLPLAFICGAIVIGFGYLTSYALYKITNKRNKL